MKRSKILAYIQISVIVCLMSFNGGIRLNSYWKTEEFPCKGHQCGCKSESDCKTHCCCGLYKNRGAVQSNDNEPKTGFQVFISSVNCKYGGDPLTTITFTAKYVLVSQVQPIRESFLCFLPQDISISLLEVFIAPPETPPRHFA